MTLQNLLRSVESLYWNSAFGAVAVLFLSNSSDITHHFLFTIHHYRMHNSCNPSSDTFAVAYDNVATCFSR